MIRSLTIGLPLGQMSQSEMADKVGRLLKSSSIVLKSENMKLRTKRFTLPALSPSGAISGTINGTLNWVDEFATNSGVRWFCLPLNLGAPGNSRDMLRASMSALERFPRLFLNLMAADSTGISSRGVDAAARFILDLSKKSASGYDNFRVGVSLNCPANAPFFPASRHEGDNVSFSFALETVELVMNVIRSTQGTEQTDLMTTRDRIIDNLVPKLQQVDTAAREIAEATGVYYCGLDASLAPFPAENSSVGAIIEELLGSSVGSEGTVLITTVLTDAIRESLLQSRVTSVGFNGVMFSVLEDYVLAAALSRRGITLGSLLALSAVCGVGIDMVPISGLSFPEDVGGVILDAAGISATLSKPLSVRVLPIPHKLENEMTSFNMDFLCDSRILGLSSAGGGLLSSEVPIVLKAPIRAPAQR